MFYLDKILWQEGKHLRVRIYYSSTKAWNGGQAKVTLFAWSLAQISPQFFHCIYDAPWGDPKDIKECQWVCEAIYEQNHCWPIFWLSNLRGTAVKGWTNYHWFYTTSTLGEIFLPQKVRDFWRFQGCNKAASMSKCHRIYSESLNQYP